jgi:hypothetical protein
MTSERLNENFAGVPWTRIPVMSKIACASTIVMIVTVVLPVEVGFARTSDFKIAYYNSNDSPNGGVCPGSLRRVSDLKLCHPQKPSTR